MYRTFSHHMLVRQENLNQFGSLFGGHVLAVVDELAFIACERTWPGRNFVTRVVREAEFAAPAHLGDVLEFTFGVERKGRSSADVRVRMLIHGGADDGVCSFDSTLVMVCVDEAGRPRAIEQD